MYKNHAYRDKTENEIRKEILEEGFDPIKISNGSGFVYALHQHPETKLLVFLEGSMDVTVHGETYRCLPGDKMIIPGNTPHSAVVGKEGCIFFWSEKIM
ncbi:MAG: cupin domain-containing protein [Candidatus Levybacteria bacterium]|nr:cupin domain-containing protein [Candidatus Levybacteria bacterium]